MKKRSLSGNVAIGFFCLGLIFVAIAFATPSWLVSDYRITGAKLDRFGLWTHCFRSLEDSQQKRFFVGCRWIYDPFTTGYDQIRGYLVPDFMVATQLFFTLAFISVIIGAILVLLYFLFCGPDQKKFILLIRVIAAILLFGAISGGIGIIVFASLANQKGWMPGQDNNFFGWSFILGAIGTVSLFIASILFFVDANIQIRKRKLLKESQTRFELKHESKA